MEPITATPPPEAPIPRTGPTTAFINSLTHLVDRGDRASLAALRRGLGKAPGDVASMHPLVVPYLPDDAHHPRNDEAWYLVGSLFGLHPSPLRGERRGLNFGATLRQLRDARGDAGGPGIDRRMVAILNAHRDDVGTHLRQAIGLLRGGDWPVDWAQLLRDILAWDHPERPAQRGWARAYYRGTPASTPASTPATTPTAD
ncbi:MAG: type I-E CRISPR-associated protein Cse2/CasB [Chloroflexi bacterium]|nr:type I-E CRISPR-associated protein Cse2/CasB [Chloroflexota bacterium]